MKNNFVQSSFVLFSSCFIACPALAGGSSVETQYFSAEIVNVRRAQTGNVMVTVRFVPKIEESTSLYVYSDVKLQGGEKNPCLTNQTTLIDGNGDEHMASNCLPPLRTDMWGQNVFENGMQLHAGSEAAFVFKFGLAGAPSESFQGMNISIPLNYNYCYEKNNGNFAKTTMCDRSPTTLSFYGIDAR